MQVNEGLDRKAIGRNRPGPAFLNRHWLAADSISRQVPASEAGSTFRVGHVGQVGLSDLTTSGGATWVTQYPGLAIIPLPSVGRAPENSAPHGPR